MTDFRKMIEERKSAHDASQAESAAKAAAERLERQRITDSGVALLQQRVIPLFERMASDLRANGLDLELHTEFDVANYSKPVPQVWVECLSYARKGDGFRMKSRPLFVRATEGQFEVGYGDEFARRMNRPITKCEPDDIQTHVESAFGPLVDEVLKKVSSHPGQW